MWLKGCELPCARAGMLAKAGNVPIDGVTRRPAQCGRRKYCVAPKCEKSGDFDTEKVLSFPDRRTVFDFDAWARHRNTNRYTRHISTIVSSQIAKGVVWPIIFEGVWASAVGLYETMREMGQLPAGFPVITIDIAGPFSLSSFALSLLLVFRTNSSYGRFDEARKFWGGVVNRSRDFVRQGITWFDPVSERDRIEMLARWMSAFPWAMMCHLRPREDYRKELKDILLAEELDYLMSTPHKPNTVLQVLSYIVNESSLDASKKFRMDENLTFFHDMLGACERLLRTPIPVPYTRHTSRFLVIWLLCLPLVIWNQVGWATPAECVVIAFVLLAIDEIGVQIEEPFSILPLESISATIQNNIKQLMADPGRDLAEAVRTGRYPIFVPEPTPAVSSSSISTASVGSSNGGGSYTGNGERRPDNGRPSKPSVSRDAAGRVILDTTRSDPRAQQGIDAMKERYGLKAEEDIRVLVDAVEGDIERVRRTLASFRERASNMKE